MEAQYCSIKMIMRFSSIGLLFKTIIKSAQYFLKNLKTEKMIDVTQTVSLSLVTLSLVATIFWFLYRYLETNNVKKFKERNVEYVNYPNQLLTMFQRKHFHLKEKRTIEKHGPVFGFNMFFDKTIIVAEPELLQIVFNKEFTNFANRRVF